MKKPQLFLLHFAGGNCHSFKFMTPMLTEFEMIPLELPGRGRRIKEGLLTDFSLAARDICQQISERLNGERFMIYGHSMGSVLALRVANILERAGKFPACIVVSGNPGPGVGERKTTYLLETEAFFQKVEKLGGLPDEVIQNRELLDFFEPILRADFEVAENNGMAEEPAVNASLFAIMGSKEDRAAEISNWARFTKSSFGYEILEGNHFFIYDHAWRITEIIRSCYNNVKVNREKTTCYE